MSDPKPASGRVLVVDDDPNVRHLLQHFLTAEGYSVELAGDGEDVILRPADRPVPDLVLLDLEMPRVGGIEVCRRLRANPATRLLPIILMTGYTESYSRAEAWDCGADEFLTKPFQLREVLSRCRSLLRIKRLVEERDSAEAVLFAWTRALEAKNPYTRGHADRVSAFAVALGQASGLSAAALEVVRKGALLHDIGKIGVPDAILNKADSLTVAEFAVIRAHPGEGARMVEPLVSVREVVPIIRWHHERLDGYGYPDGLKGDAIPPEVRVVTVADVYDSLASARPYRVALPVAQCLEILREDARSGALDADLVECFATHVVGALPSLAPS